VSTFPPLPPLPPQAERPRTALRIAVVVATLGLAIAVVVGLMVLAPQTHRMAGSAMAPTLQDDDRAVFVRPLGVVARGDVVSFLYPRNPSKLFSMRIVGLPGERVAIVEGVVHIDGRRLDEPYLGAAPRPRQSSAPIQLAADEYFVLGDNRGNASDSREWGPVARRYIRKRLAFIWWRAQG
jgi:signal peptidase I